MNFLFRSDGQAKIQTPIMQSASGLHDQIFEAFAEIAINGMDNVKYFDTANTMFNANAFF
jgi:hypothetical protein